MQNQLKQAKVEQYICNLQNRFSPKLLKWTTTNPWGDAKGETRPGNEDK